MVEMYDRESYKLGFEAGFNKAIEILKRYFDYNIDPRDVINTMELK